MTRYCRFASLLTICCLLLPSVLFGGNKPDRLRDSIHAAKEQLLTTDELLYINHLPKLTVAGPKAFPPFYYYEGDGSLHGMASDYLGIVLDYLGVNYSVKPLLPWPRVLKDTADKEIDLIGCLAQTEDRKRFIDFSDPYLSFPMVIITTKDAPFVGGLDDLYGKKVALIERVVTGDWLKRDGIDVRPVRVDTPLSALKAVSTGKAFAHIENLAAASYLIQRHGLSNLKVAGPTPYDNYNLFMGVRKGLEPLVPILNKALAAIDPAVHSQIRNRWITVRYEHGIKMETVVWAVSAGLSISALLFAVFYLWNRRLEKEIGQRIKAENSLRLSEEKFRLVFETSPDAIVLSRLSDGMFMEVNKGFARMTGYKREETLGKTAIDLDIWKENSERHALVDRLKQEGSVVNFQCRFNRKDKKVCIGLMSAVQLTIQGESVILSITRDITEREMMQKEIEQAGKLKSIGILAGGIAHDFNNYLMGIINNIHLIKMNIDDDAKAVRFIENAEKSVKKATGLTQHLLTFSKGGLPDKAVITIETDIIETATFNLSGSNVKAAFNFEKDLWPVKADRDQISRVVSNLVINAREAMADGGRLTISAENMEKNPHDAVSAIPPGSYVKVSFEDEGPGIGKEHIRHIFDPFFTTKPSGNGLGLAIAYSIIKHHSGLITVSSGNQKGTVFCVYLPALPGPLPEKPAKSNLRTESRPVVPGKIMVMDDDAEIREGTRTILEGYGVAVETFRDGKTAVEAYDNAFKSAEPFELVIMDLTIPGGMGGKEAVKQILSIDPAACVIVSSGYSSDPVMADFKTYGFAGKIKKPYAVKELMALISSVQKR